MKHMAKKVIEKSLAVILALCFTLQVGAVNNNDTNVLLNNLVTNGSFKNGTNGWTQENITNVSVTNGLAQFTATAQYGGLYQFNYTVISGHKYYVFCYINSSVPTTISVQKNGSPWTVCVNANSPGNSILTKVSGIGTAAENATDYRILVFDGRTSGWTAIQCSHITLIDLTSTFGAGNEPTQAEMDAMVQDGWNNYNIITPVQSTMETQAQADAILAQLTSSTKSVSLSEDKIEGMYSVKVSTGDETGKDYAGYTLVDTGDFNISEFSRIVLYVKPAMGSKWIEFYTNNTLILNDANSDGRFEVGQDIKSGIWNKIVLDLTKTQGSVTKGNDLTVHTNEYSTWLYDDIKSVVAPVASINVSRMDNSRTRMNGGRLEFNLGTSPLFDVTPTILVSNRYPSFERKDTTEVDFSQGTLDSAAVKQNGSVEFNLATDRCTGGTAISGGDSSTYAASKAFDNDTTTTYWQSSQTGSSVKNNAYIGYNFASSKNIRAIKIIQTPGTSDCNNIKSAKLQYYEDSTWKDAQTISLLTDGSNQTVNIEVNKSAQQWRLLANDSPASSYKWQVFEIEMFEYGSYTSPIIDISSVGASSSSTNIKVVSSDETNLKVETNLSLNGGATWQGWAAVSDNGNIPGINTQTNLSNARIQYKISVRSSQISIPKLYEVSMSILGGEYTDASSFESGKLEHIFIDSSYADVNGVIDSKQTRTSIPSIGTSVCAMSGDGSTLYYAEPTDSGKLYKMNLYTGVTTKVSDQTNVNKIKVNYDGSMAAFRISSLSKLYLYDNTRNTKEFYINQDTVSFSIQDNGTVAYITHTTDYNYLYRYNNSTNESLLGNLDKSNSVCDAPGNGDMVYYSSAKTFFCKEKALTGWNTTAVYTANDTITSVFSNANGSRAFFVTSSGSYCYEKLTNTVRKLDINFDIKKALYDDKLFGVDALKNGVIYDSSTGESVLKSLPDTVNSYFDADNIGKKILYLSTGSGISCCLIDESKSKESYLISFDGKNTWCTFKDGAYVEIGNKATPTKDDFINYGMSAQEVNALDASDFSAIYEDGRQIYTVDVAIYFNSDDPYITPSLKSISLITNEESDDSNVVTQAIYAAKKKDFDGSNWRKVKKLYPIELAQKEATYYYFIYVDGKYNYFDGTQWHEETAGEITTMLMGVDANWTSIAGIGMTAEELKAIPEASLTSKLASKQFSVVYCMKVFDTSTVNYSCIINADYVEDMFTGTTLTLNIVMNDGTSMSFTTLSDTQVEDFMEWISNRQHGRGPVFYIIKVGDMNYFINYYMIQSITVEE